MKHKLVPGAELDVLSPREARELLEDYFREEATTIVRAAAQGKTDANGHLLLNLYAPPQGFELLLTRLLVNADGFTPGNPFSAGAGYIDVLRGDRRVDFKSIAPGTTGIPALLTTSSTAAVLARNGEQIAIELFIGPFSTGIEAELQGILRRLPAEAGR